MPRTNTLNPFVILLLVPIIWIISYFSCNVSAETANRVLENQGFTNVRMKDRALLSCSESDSFGSHFEATNVQGKRVQGTICCGIMKDCTVRF